MFRVDAYNLKWLDSIEDSAVDLCLHGRAVAVIGDETYEYDATVSAAALYLLRTLKEDHYIREGSPMLPCCGSSFYANETLDTVSIVSCPNGVDWSVIHDGGQVRLVTETGKETIVPLPVYRERVHLFADKIEAFYESSSPKKVPDDKIDREGYMAFWNEWKRLRHP